MGAMAVPERVLVSVGVEHRDPDRENLEAANGHLRRRERELEQRVDELKLANDHLRRLLDEYRRTSPKETS